MVFFVIDPANFSKRRKSGRQVTFVNSQNQETLVINENNYSELKRRLELVDWNNISSQMEQTTVIYVDNNKFGSIKYLFNYSLEEIKEDLLYFS